ncbi:hypothetical protein VaNZ11_012443 [Volvox africanus]|uniref:GPI inositol-deacylase n=1 Tax=Volvox africanus TaxID=51714 RepID=A0ABQ5SE05_9CHLO|nr:hypothetical protein VaNZ11_012443 [Volvox africanus]
MALSRSAVRTARHRRWLWALTACAGATGLVIIEEQLQNSAREHGQTTSEFAKRCVTEAASNVKKTTGVARALLRTAMSSALGAMQQRNFDPGSFRADLVATMADLAADTPTRRHLVSLGGGYFLDWLLRLAYPHLPVPSCGRDSVGDSRSSLACGSTPAERDRSTGAVCGTIMGASSSGAFDLVLRPGAGAGDGAGAGPQGGSRHDESRKEGELALDETPDGEAWLSSSGGASASPVAARLRREAERALEGILEDGLAAGALLDRPGAVPLLLRAVAQGRASRVVAEALAGRAAEARAASEAMTADLRDVMEALRGSSAGGGGLSGGGLALQCTAAGLLTAWAAGSSANRAKLTGLGLPEVLAEVATAVSGMSSRAAVGLQWQLLRLARVMAEHSSSSDSHHLAACILPLLYTAADAAAAEDAAMASYAVDTLAAAVRHGGAPVAEVVANSTMPHLLWQLAEGLGAHRVPLLDGGKEAALAARGVAADGKGEGKKQAAGAAQAGAAQAAKPKASRGWLWGRSGSPSGSRPTASTEAAVSSTASAGTGASGGVHPSASVKSQTVMQVKDPTVAASVAAAVAELACSALLPEAQVPRWRDWLLDVLCADGFDRGTSVTGTGTKSAIAAARPVAALRGASLPSGQSVGATTAPLRELHGEGLLVLATANGSCNSSRSSNRSQDNSQSKGGQVQLLPSWLTLPERGRKQACAEAVSSSGSGSGSGSSTAAAIPPDIHQDQVLGTTDGHEGMRTLRFSVVSALSALSHMPGNHGLQAAHYWLSRLLSELAARTLPYTSLVYLEGPRAPQDLIHAVPVLPSYVKSVADALERAADAVADDSPSLPPHLEFDLAGSGLVGRPTHGTEPRRTGGDRSSSSSSSSIHTGSTRRGVAGVSGAGSGTGAGTSQHQHQQQQHQRRSQHELDVAAYRQAAHVVDVVVAERKAADALEALCAVVAPDLDKQRWLLHRGVLPLMHRLTRTADDPRVVLQEQGQPGAEKVEQEVAMEDIGAAAAVAEAEVATKHAQAPVPAVVSEILSDHEGGPSLCLQRQVARMLALLALLPDAQDGLGVAAPDNHPAAGTGRADGGIGSGWLSWLRHAACSSDCRLSSNATRALLHLAALEVNAVAVMSAANTVANTAGSAAHGLRTAAAPVTAAAAAVVVPPPVFLDGIHLLNPGAQHHWALVRQATADVAAVTLEERSATVAAEASINHVSETDAVGGDARTHGSALPTGPDAPGAAVVAMNVATNLASNAPAVVPHNLSHVGVGVGVGVAVGGDVAGANIASMRCRASGDGGGALLVPVDTAPVSSVSASLLGALWFVASWPLSLLGTTALAWSGLLTSYGGEAPGTSPPLLPAGAAATPSGALPPGSYTDAAAMLHPGPTGGGGGTSEPQLPSVIADGNVALTTQGAPTSSDVSTLLAAGVQRLVTWAGAGSVAGGISGPASALQPGLMRYPDLTSNSTDQTVLTESGAGAAATDPALPLVDVVFVHGIRGGPFITWRKAGVMTRGSAASHMERSACWPSAWLAEEVPGARLLSVEYLAPVSAWEGESLPLEDNVSRVMAQLAAAGVGTGQRPVVFVAHSMGGLLVKEMLARSMDQAAEGGPHAALAPSIRGIVFFGTPHFGNGLAAMGWRLRHVPGALPAPSLARLTPGPHLLSLNDRLRELHDSQGGALRLVSLLEGQPTQLSGVIPRILIVAPDSAYPGFGASITLPENDHIDCCKPASQAAPAYLVVRDLVLHAIRVAVPGGG